LKAHDRDLGMSRKITRRDFVNGVSAGAVGATLLPQWAAAQEFAPEQSPDYYPPARTGMRGDHPGSFEVAHQLRDTRNVDLSAVAHTNETFDLVIAGGGISGVITKRPRNCSRASASISTASSRITLPITIFTGRSDWGAGIFSTRRPGAPIAW